MYLGLFDVFALALKAIPATYWFDREHVKSYAKNRTARRVRVKVKLRGRVVFEHVNRMAIIVLRMITSSRRQIIDLKKVEIPTDAASAAILKLGMHSRERLGGRGHIFD